MSLGRKKVGVSPPELLRDERAIEVELTGCPPGLLMNSPKSMMMQQAKARKKGDLPSVEADTESRAYRMANGTLYIPSEAIYGTLVNSSGAYKIGKKGAASLVAGTVRIWPDEISLGTDKYEIDVRPVVVQRNRIIRSRPLIREWRARFHIVYDETYGINAEVLQKMLVEAGKRIGILDFRPQHRGRFGRFLVTDWKELKKKK